MEIKHLPPTTARLPRPGAVGESPEDLGAFSLTPRSKRITLCALLQVGAMENTLGTSEAADTKTTPTSGEKLDSSFDCGWQARAQWDKEKISSDSLIKLSDFHCSAQ